MSHAAILRSHWCRHSGSRWRLLRVSKLQFSHWERSGLKKLFVKWRTKEANVCPAHHPVTRISFHVTPVSSKVACQLMNENTILKSLRFVCHLNVQSLLLADAKLNFTLAICQPNHYLWCFVLSDQRFVATVRKMFIGLSMVVFPGWLKKCSQICGPKVVP